MTDPFKPSPALLAKLASVIVHFDEYVETGDRLDIKAARSVLADEAVVEWLEQMRRMALLPLKRS